MLSWLLKPKSPGYWGAIAPYWDVVDVHESPRTFQKQLAQVPHEPATLLVAHWLFSEVHNGGFVQFFWNGTGVLAPEALQAFQVLQLPDAARAIERAMGYIGKPYPRSCRVRQRRMKGIWERSPDKEQLWDALRAETKAFYKAAPSRRFRQAADAFARRVGA